uniref:Uncharacterized protein LOC105065921 n=1 Tax=Camelus bactrianus TaxID=9837 RepID=A0A9W3EJP2_CAMBA|nr:uncharacterized protein LOC105065921 [Camelus bactrianus]
MAWTVLLLGLLAHGSGVDSQTVVTQEPSLSVSPGGTVTLTCGLSSGSVTTSNYPGWYQQTPGQAPRALIYNTNSRPSGVPSRFSGSISGNKAALTITGAQPEDEAEYYCALYMGSGSYTDTVMYLKGKCYQNLPLSSEGSALRGRRGREKVKCQHRIGRRVIARHLLELVALLLSAAARSASGRHSEVRLKEDCGMAPPLLDAKSQLLEAVETRVQIQDSVPPSPRCCAQEEMVVVAGDPSSREKLQ